MVLVAPVLRYVSVVTVGSHLHTVILIIIITIFTRAALNFTFSIVPIN